MQSLRETLDLISPYLPPGFSPGNGIKSLFPNGYAGSISLLSAYVYEKTGIVTIDQDDYATYYVAADGAGRWFFSWTGNPFSLSGSAGTIADANVRIQAGFTFLYSNDGFGHGYMDGSRPDATALSCNQGQDVWISENWPNIFLSDVNVGYQQAAGFTSLPSVSNIWVNAGFQQDKFTALKGGTVSCSGQSGSSIFPFEEQTIFCCVQVRDIDLLKSLQNLPATEFWNLFRTSQASQATIDLLRNTFTVRYVSPDSRLAVISGSPRSLGAVPLIRLVGATISVAGWTPTVSGGVENIVNGLLATGAGLGMILASPATGPGLPEVAVVGTGVAAVGNGIFYFGVGEVVFAGGSALLSPEPVIQISPTAQNPSGATVYGASSATNAADAATGNPQFIITVAVGGFEGNEGIYNVVVSSQPVIDPDEIDLDNPFPP